MGFSLYSSQWLNCSMLAAVLSRTLNPDFTAIIQAKKGPIPKHFMELHICNFCIKAAAAAVEFLMREMTKHASGRSKKFCCIC